MSLFPAYASVNESKDEKKSSLQNDESWLSLSSFNTELTKVVSSKQTVELDDNNDGASTSNNRQNELSKKRRKKEKVKDVEVLTASTSSWDDFQIDKTRNIQYLHVKTISRPSVPKYHRTLNIFNKFRKQKKMKRYFQYNLEKCDNSGTENESKLTKEDLKKNVPKVVDENFTGFKQEEDMSQTTAFYNRSLAENPNNIDMWLQYIRFQDAVYKFEKTYRKGSIVKGLRVTAERKLAILDKALTHLPNNETLLRERLNICAGVYPADELYEQLNKLVEKEQAKEQTINCCLGQSFWKIKNMLMKTGHALPNLFLIFIAKQKICDTQENWIDTFTGEKLEFVGLKNRMLSLFRRLTSADMCTRRCGLIWRLYLQFLHENFDPSLCRNAYYSAVEECPWLKALYIDAAIYIPAELPQIQDLLIEKQLRLHVTPEELHIMRN